MKKFLKDESGSAGLVVLVIMLVGGTLASGVVPVSELEKGKVTINKEVIENATVAGTQAEYNRTYND
tara:strand:+ start:158 stop:358 length:201 start_codon:yes stop_codon:yes gene_type:complete